MIEKLRVHKYLRIWFWLCLKEILADVLEDIPKETLEEEKVPKVLAAKLKGILEDLEQEIEKIGM